MRALAALAAELAATTVIGCAGVAAAAPKDYCTELKGVQTGQNCQIRLDDAGYTVDITFPTSYPDLKSVADYISKTRDQFLDAAKSSAPHQAPYALEITTDTYGTAIPPRGTAAVVLKDYQYTGGAHPTTSYKAFNWDQTYRKAITYDTLWRPGTDPLPVVFPIVQSELRKQFGPDIAIQPVIGLDPATYQEFAITDDGVIFFFSQGALLAEAAGAPQMLVPRSAIDPMLA